MKSYAAALALAAGGLHPHAMAVPLADALERPALRVSDPAHAVLLSAAWAGPRMVAVGERGLILASEDQGRTWKQMACPVSVTLTMVRFADARHGVAVGHGGTVLTTSDAGASWAVRLDGRRLARIVRDAAATPQQIADADRLLADGPDKPFLDVAVWNAQRMLAVGAYGLALYTRDGGRSWESWMDRLPNPRGMHWYVARHAGSTVLLAGEQGLLARSIDDGASFQALPSPYKGSWFTAQIAGDGSLLLGGLRGNAWRSADGLRWTAVALPTTASILGSTTDAQGRIWLASQAGELLQVSDDAGRPITGQPMPMPAALLALPDGGMAVFGMAGAKRLAAAALTGGQP